jgi:hypothetical protein
MKKKNKKETGEATRESVKKEMAKPRVAQSIRDGKITPASAQIARVKQDEAV